MVQHLNHHRILILLVGHLLTPWSSVGYGLPSIQLFALRSVMFRRHSISGILLNGDFLSRTAYENIYSRMRSPTANKTVNPFSTTTVVNPNCGKNYRVLNPLTLVPARRPHTLKKNVKMLRFTSFYLDLTNLASAPSVLRLLMKNHSQISISSTHVSSGLNNFFLPCALQSWNKMSLGSLSNLTPDIKLQYFYYCSHNKPKPRS